MVSFHFVYNFINVKHISTFFQAYSGNQFKIYVNIYICNECKHTYTHKCILNINRDRCTYLNLAVKKKICKRCVLYQCWIGNQLNECVQNQHHQQMVSNIIIFESFVSTFQAYQFSYQPDNRSNKIVQGIKAVSFFLCSLMFNFLYGII